MKKLILLLGLVAFSCADQSPKNEGKTTSSKENNQSKKQNVPKQNPVSTIESSAYSFKVVGTMSNYGYQIFDASGKMMINQPTIPAIQGNKGFQTENDAQVAAKFVIQKIDKGYFPPTFTVAELDSLGIVH